MRVISGKYQRKQLKTIDTNTTRPTTDRVKENIFNLTQNVFCDTIILDLFAGSGALGIECISRGAKHVYFVDNSFQAIDVLKQNLLNINESYTIIQKDALSAIRHFEKLQLVFNVIFLDPPYQTDLLCEVMCMLQNSTIINDESIIVVETYAQNACDFIGFETIKEKKYGQTKIMLLRKGV